LQTFRHARQIGRSAPVTLRDVACAGAPHFAQTRAGAACVQLQDMSYTRPMRSYIAYWLCTYWLCGCLSELLVCATNQGWFIRLFAPLASTTVLVFVLPRVLSRAPRRLSA
jgi:hypothetical protein